MCMQPSVKVNTLGVGQKGNLKETQWRNFLENDGVQAENVQVLKSLSSPKGT